MRIWIQVLIVAWASGQLACQSSSRNLPGPSHVNLAPVGQEPDAIATRPDPETPAQDASAHQAPTSPTTQSPANPPDSDASNPAPSITAESPPISPTLPTQTSPTASSASPARTLPNTPLAQKYADLLWLPQSLNVSCEAKWCPPSVGLVIAITGQTSDDVSYQRCTATLIAPDRILTAGHCDMLAQGPMIFFVGQGALKQIRFITKPSHLEFQPSSNPIPPLAPDVAILKLESPITTVTPSPLAPSKGKQDIYDHLDAYVIDETPRGEKAKVNTYQMHLMRCRTQRTAYFPYYLPESPDLIYFNECPTHLGNSGSPMFDTELPEVQAVVQDGQQKRKDGTVGDISIAFNLHCLGKNGVRPKSCAVVTDDAVQARQTTN